MKAPFINFNTKDYEPSYQEYLNRFIRAKELIKNNATILENMVTVFEHTHNNKSLNKDIMKLGEGNEHVVYSVYKDAIQDGNEKLSLALRLKWNVHNAYEVYDETYLNFEVLSEIHEFQKAFADNKNPPYFIGLVQWKDSQYDQKFFGFITQDVTCRKSIFSTSEKFPDAEYLKIDNKFHFIDPRFPDIHASSQAQDYLDHIIKIN